MVPYIDVGVVDGGGRPENTTHESVSMNCPNQQYNSANQHYSFPHEMPGFSPQCAYRLETTATHESFVNGPNPIPPQYTSPNEALSTNEATHAPYPVENQLIPVVNGPKPQYSQPNEALYNSSAQTGLANEGKSRADPSNQTQPRNVKHFSHHHALHLSKVQEEDYIHCSVCDRCLSGSAYSCTKQRCNFDIHKSCFELPQKIHHK
ncbi:hypothetical protein HYC85_007202 [Camellia sinensis]|uniref:DC1 domain-containing protein n=1 Tax=Camellia sinensis TaxID=4442 RepID=A0A7J7HQN2_CAMSI|nr:hypothetical protein HYC85_007202 [Camellia sinensis]